MVSQSQSIQPQNTPLPSDFPKLPPGLTISYQKHPNVESSEVSIPNASENPVSNLPCESSNPSVASVGKVNETAQESNELFTPLV